MEATIVQFLMGILGGTIAGLFAVQRKVSTESLRATRTAGNTNPSSVKRTRTMTRPKRLKAAPLRRKKTTKPRSSALVSLPQVEASSSSLSAYSKAISTCPSCGLEAPDALIAEHFSGSPSHREGKKIREGADDASPEITCKRDTDDDDDPRRTLRNLLQMLVPPRAFGHRHLEKRENPISRIVHELDPIQKRLIEPLTTPLSHNP